MSHRPPVRGTRLFKLASMSAAVAGDFARAKLKSAFHSDDDKAEADHDFLIHAGLRIAHTLGDLKGAAMKVGQMASTATDLLPPEIAEALQGLQKHAPPMDYEDVGAMILAELGAEPERLFRRFDHAPFAAASIGQVHRATTDDGREVVVKIQYPGIDEAVGSDLSQLRLAMRFGGVVVDPELMDAIFSELHDLLIEELDYCNEADNVREFAAFHERHPWIVVPEVIGERSSQRILTLSYEAGDDLHHVLEPPYGDADRQLLSEHLVEMICSQLFEGRILHGDPNPANFAFREDGTLVLYDFGCVKRYSEETVSHFAGLIRAIQAGDPRRLDGAMMDLGVLKANHPIPTELWTTWLGFIAPPIRTGGSYDFAAGNIYEDILSIVPQMVRHMTAFQPSADIAIIKRTVGGHYDSLRMLGCEVDVGDRLAAYLDGFEAGRRSAPCGSDEPPSPSRP